MRTPVEMGAAVSAMLLALPATAAAFGPSPPVVPAGLMPTIAEITLLLFTLTNSVRVIAYLPQIWKAATTDANGARGISCLTWTLFLVSNLATAGYAVVNLSDWIMAAIFVANATGCAAILACSAWRRRAGQRRRP